MSRRIMTILGGVLFAFLASLPAASRSNPTDNGDLEAAAVEDADDESVVATATKTSESENAVEDRALEEDGQAANPPAPAPARDGGEAALRYTDPRTYQFKLKVKVDAPAESAAKNVVVVAPILRNWPEQKVRLLHKEFTDGGRYKEIDKPGQCKTFNFQVAEIPAGESASVELLYEVTRWRIEFTAPADELTLAHRAPRDVREQFAGPAPGLEMNHPKIKELTRQLQQQHEQEGAWDLIKGFWKWTRDNVDFKNGDFRGALFAVEQHCGDCEEMSALFVSMCRLSDGVARSVWVEGHNYPEFYLLDKQGHGHWIPAQVVGPAWFGEMIEYRPIFQKGDRFLDPFHREFRRYTPQTVKAAGKTEPKLTVEHQIISDQDINGPSYKNPK